MPQDTQVETLAGIAREQQRKFYGTYRGVVIDNADPRARGRLLVEVPSVLGQGTHLWAAGKFMFGGNSAEAAIFVPAVGSQVLVEFVEGSPGSPIWSGVYYPDGSDEFAPPESYDLDPGTLHLIRTEMGIEIRLEDDRVANSDGGEQRLVVKHPSGTEVTIDTKGVVNVVDAAGAELLLDPDQSITRLKGQGDGMLEMTDSGLVLKHGSVEVSLDASGVTVDAPQIKLDGDQVKLGRNASSNIMNADAFINTVFAAHTHPTPAGPSGTPVPPGTPANASSLMTVKGS